MITKLARSTSTRPDCLLFQYIVAGDGSRLSVLIEDVNGNRRLLWDVGPNGFPNNVWKSAVLPVSSGVAFKVRIFKINVIVILATLKHNKIHKTMGMRK